MLPAFVVESYLVYGFKRDLFMSIGYFVVENLIVQTYFGLLFNTLNLLVQFLIAINIYLRPDVYFLNEHFYKVFASSIIFTGTFKNKYLLSIRIDTL